MKPKERESNICLNTKMVREAGKAIRKWHCLIKLKSATMCQQVLEKRTIIKSKLKLKEQFQKKKNNFTILGNITVECFAGYTIKSNKRSRKNPFVFLDAVIFSGGIVALIAQQYLGIDEH